MKLATLNVEYKPAEVKNETFSLQDWKFELKSGGLLPSQELNNLQTELKLNAIPDAVFGYSNM